MGRSTTPTYRVEYRTDNGYWTPAAWDAKHDGRATQANLERHCEAVMASTEPGGVNAHLGRTIITSARLIRQSTGEEIATYRACMVCKGTGEITHDDGYHRTYTACAHCKAGEQLAGAIR